MEKVITTKTNSAVAGEADFFFSQETFPDDLRAQTHLPRDQMSVQKKGRPHLELFNQRQRHPGTPGPGSCQLAPAYELERIWVCGEKGRTKGTLSKLSSL